MKNLVVALFLGLLLFCMNNAFGQKEKPSDYGIKSKKALDYFYEGKEWTRARDYLKAAESFKKAIELEPDFGDANFALGEALWAKKKYQEAIPYFERTKSSSRAAIFGTLNSLLGDCYYYTSQYENAAECYSIFLNEPKGLKVHLESAQKNLPKAKFAAEAMNHPVKFSPVNLGSNINSVGRDYLPFLTADDNTLLFTAHREETTGGFSLEHKDYPEDIYISEYKEGKWLPAQNIGPPVNTPDYEGAASITQDGKVVFFAGDYKNGLGNYDLYYSVRANGKWTTPVNMGPEVNSDGWDSQPFLAPDGKTLYFSSRRRGGVGEKDVWFTKWENGKWGKAQNLGTPINTAGNEQCPFIHADGRTMYFSSDYHPGFGGDDLFVSYHDENGWKKPENMGYPLNTSANEGNIFINTKGTRGYINSDRPGGYGLDDLYEFLLDERFRPQISTFLRGVTRDSISRVPVQARIKLVDVQTGDTVRAMTSGKGDGKFLMSVPMNREYAAYAEAPGYIFTSKHFYLKDLKEDIYFDIAINLLPLPPPTKPTEPVKPAAPVVVVLNNIFFDLGKYDLKKESYIELAVLLGYLQQNPKMKIEIQGHTDNTGSEESNITLSQNRAESVMNYLISKGIDPQRVSAAGYGESQPLAPNDTEEGRARNRRTAFQILEM